MAEWKFVRRLPIQDRIEKIIQILNENKVVQKVIEQNRQRIAYLKRMEEAKNA